MKKTLQEIALLTACIYKPDLIGTDAGIFSEAWMREGWRAFQRKEAGDDYDRQAMAQLPRKLCGGDIQDGETLTDALLRIVTQRAEVRESRARQYGERQIILAEAERKAIEAVRQWDENRNRGDE